MLTRVRRSADDISCDAALATYKMLRYAPTLPRRLFAMRHATLLPMSPPRLHRRLFSAKQD